MEERFTTFTVLVASLNRSIHWLKTDAMARFELKSSHVSCLYYVHKHEAITAKALCEICGEDKANVSRAIKYLEQKGYLECSAKGQKRNQGPLVLTAKGREVASYITERIDNVLTQASAGLDERDRTVMYTSLALIEDNLAKLCNSLEADLGLG